MVDQHHWQLDGSAPELYEQYLVPAITQKWADDLVGRPDRVQEKRYSTSPAAPELSPVPQAGACCTDTLPAWT